MTTTLLTNGEGSAGVTATVAALTDQKSALEAIEIGIRLVEDDTNIDVVGTGGLPNLLGKVECDASIMDGRTLQSGSVGALKGFKHPISIAHEVYKKLPHVLVVGEGAARFAWEIGAEIGDLLTEESRNQWQTWLHNHVPSDLLTQWPNVSLAKWAHQAFETEKRGDTTVYLAIDASGNIAAGASSSGLPYKYPGRLGDSPVIGAGIYADNRYGAAACTHTGEMTIRACTAHSVVCYMRHGASVKDACYEAINDLQRLKGDDIATVVVHGMSREGEIYVISTSEAPDTKYWHWQEGMSEPQLIKAVILS